MGKTYRNVPEKEIEREEMLERLNVRKIKHIDRKHQKAVVADGAIHIGIEDDEGGYLYDTPMQKKLFKKAYSKRKRHFNKKLNYDD